MYKVIQFLDGLAVGGKERVAVNLAEALAHRGWQSHIVASRGREGLEPSSAVHYYCADRQSRWDRAGMKRIARYIDDHEIDIVHSHNHSSSWLFRFVLRRCKRRVLHVFHDHHGPAVNDRKMAVVDWLLLRRVDAVIAVSEELRARAEKLLKVPADRCLALPNGIAIYEPQPAPTGRPTVIQVANIHWPKGHDRAMRVAAKVRQSVPDLRWICPGRIAEDSEYVANVRRLIDELNLGDCVELLGECDNVRKLIHQANVGVLTSDREGLPMSILEYMAEGRPVVMTDTGQGPDIIRAANGGAVAPMDDDQAFADHLVSLLTDPAQAAELGTNARQHVIENYSIDHMTKAVEDLYRKLLVGRS
jgi:glycosyltransferase involved in cell wall biosynthesis